MRRLHHKSRRFSISIMSLSKRMFFHRSSDLSSLLQSSSSSSSFHRASPSVLSMELTGKLARALSTLLSARSRSAWLDLPAVDREAAARRLASAAEAAGAALPAAAGWIEGVGRPEGAAVTSGHVCK